MTYNPRETAHVIKEALQNMPVVVITGMRQSGKSNFMKMEAELKGRRYVTIDDFAYLSAAREDPESFIDTDAPISTSKIGRDAKLNAATTSRYLSLFDASFIINRTPPYLRNPASRLIKSPKIYMTDSGLACFLAGVKRLLRMEIASSMQEGIMWGFDMP